MANADRLIEVFNEAKARPAGPERQRFLAETCRDEPELKGQVLSLLQAHEGSGDFLKNTLLASTTVITEKPGDKIGRYKLLQQIGEGGCGVVYMAEQAEPVRRRVALKVIKLGMDTKQVVARFEAERQALALMDHPNIAKVFDAGATDTGRPFFVMELVRGIKITEYCDQNNLSTTERLDLFIQVCQAVQHAHQKGIIHRDIKPSNILVTQHDSVAVPKVIDFGIAKATTDQRLTDKTLFTAFEQFIGTPAYMSPEQAQMSGLDIDTRTDIYSLGVLLYELLTGKTPFDAKELIAAGLDEMRRTIREREPVRPSTKLSTMVEGELTTAAKHRGSDPPRLIHLLRGDLDWIVMKCLEKDRSRRYETANGLAMDLKRHVNNEPITARPPSAAYQFQKFARRNKAALLTAAVIVLALLLAIGALAVSTFRIAREQRTTKSALEAETRAKGQLEQTLDRERRDSYFYRITLAHRELSADNLGRALQLLGQCPEDLRGWEWNYLMRLCRVEPVILRDLPEVHSVAYHPTGKQLAAACGDGTVKLFDSTNGALLQTLHGHQTYVFGVVFSPTGRHLASASADRTIRIWEIASGKELFRIPGHLGDYTGFSYGVAFGPDGRLLLAGGEDGIATVRDTADGSELYRLSEKHENTAVSAAFSPDGRFLATGSWAGMLRIWDAQTGQLIRKTDAHTHRISAIVFHPHGQWLATAGFDRTVKVWDAKNGELLQTLRGHFGVISGLACSQDGRRLFSGGTEDKLVKVWDPLSGREILNLRGHTIACHSLAFSPAAEKLASAGGDGTIRIWDATRLKGDEGLESLTREHEHEVWSVDYSADGQLLASGSWSGMLSIWDARTGAHLRSLTSRDVRNVFRVAFSPDGEHITANTVSEDRVPTVRVWQAKTGKNVLSIRAKGPSFFVTYDRTGRYLVREGQEHTVEVRDANSGEVVGIVGRHDRQIWGMAFSPDGRHLATASNDGTVRVWAWDPQRLASEQRPRFKLPVHMGGYCNRVAFSSDSQHLATGGEGQTVKIWNATTGREEHALSGHTGDVFTVAFSPDGRWLASGGEDTTIRLWDAKSWKLLHTLRGHTGLINSLVFSPDSRHLASGSRDHTMKIWDTARWEETSAR